MKYPEQGGSGNKTEATRKLIWVISLLDFILRLTALIGSFSSAVVMAASDQTLPNFTTRVLRFKAQYSDLPTFTSEQQSHPSRDLLKVMLAFLTGAASAATAVVYVAHAGAPQANWYSVCQQYNRFCDHISGSLVGSLVGVFAFLLITLLSAIGISTHR